MSPAIAAQICMRLRADLPWSPLRPGKAHLSMQGSNYAISQSRLLARNCSNWTKPAPGCAPSALLGSSRQVARSAGRQEHGSRRAYNGGPPRRQERGGGQPTMWKSRPFH